MVKLIALDIDGTLFHHGKIHPKTKEAIEKAKHLKIPVVIATGRNISTIEPIAKHLGLMGGEYQFVAQNGGQVFQYKNINEFEIMYTSTFDINTVNKIFEIAKDNKIRLFAYSENEKYAYSNNRFSVFKIFMKFKSKRQKLLGYAQLASGPKISKFICFAKAKHMLPLRKFAESANLSVFEFSYVTDAHANIEINPQNINKAFGLKYVCDALNIEANDVIYFGDGENDIAALEWAGTGVAMKNAKQFVKDSANDVTDLTVSDGGVGDYLLSKILK